MDETELIRCVQKYPLLYDLNSPLYLDQLKKEEAWNEISTFMSASAYDCKSKWTRLRDNYRKALILRKRKIGITNNRPLKYENELSFLNKKISFAPKNRIKTAADFADITDPYPLLKEQEPQKSVKNDLLVETRSKPHTVSSKSSKKQEHEKSKQIHDLNKFFESIAETVKTFPKKEQIRLKRVIFNIVNDVETSLADGQEVNYTTIPEPTTSTRLLSITDDGVIGTNCVPNEDYILTEYNSPPTMQNTTKTEPVEYLDSQIKEENVFDICIDDD